MSTGDVRVVQDGDGYYLTAPEINTCPDLHAIKEVAARVLARVNGVARAMDASYRPVRLAGRYNNGDDAVVTVDAALEIRFTMTAAVVVHDASGREVPTPPPAGPVYVQVAADVPEAAEALDILGKPGQLSWGEMYKVFEIVTDQVPDEVRRKDWGISRADETRFTSSANHPGANGEHRDGRHARPFRPELKVRWSQDEARQFISRLVLSWLSHEAAQRHDA
ncbi:hypothetical protein [Nocardia sp. NPDC060249]|uniref:hypothetical protein n=1 Tax=Nocardia sp. NPDC060249 TaxID=3347082 RepID=UPI003652F9C2